MFAVACFWLASFPGLRGLGTRLVFGLLFCDRDGFYKHLKFFEEQRRETSA